MTINYSFDKIVFNYDISLSKPISNNFFIFLAVYKGISSYILIEFTPVNHPLLKDITFNVFSIII